MANSVANPTAMELNAHQFALLNQWFEQAVDLPPPERDAFVAKVRAEHGDQLAEELIRLFTAGDEPTGTMNYASPQSIAQPAAFHAGETILDRFRIVRALGRGGMGEVYEAQDRELGPVALKTIRRDLLGDPGVLRRFKQEVQLARQVTSPHVCRIHEFFTLPDDGQHRPGAFLTMELVEGETLAQRIRQAPLAWSEAEPIVMELCQGLQALHSLGLVHRDFKPANTMLARRGKLTQAVVMDLGLALRPEESAGGQAKLTMTGGIVGTPGYMAPEQFEGSQVSPATDIYALGLVMYEMTTGRRPFEASTPLAAAVRRNKRPPPVSSIRPGLPRRLDLVIAKCLEFDPADRFASAEAVANALRGDTWNPAGQPPLWMGIRRNWVLAGAAILALALLIGAAVLKPPSFHSRYQPSEAVLGWYNKGLEAFREGTYLKAEGLFQTALDADKEFGLARVHLAEAWDELDFKGNADEAMAAVTGTQEDGMSSSDRVYAEAVRATLRRDYKEAVAGFRNVLKTLPRSDKAWGAVDLGRIEEKAGNIPAALDAYRLARTLAPDSPNPYLRSAVLESREGQDVQAAADFDRASSLFTTLGALEGDAEVAYQRSYWQSVRGDYDSALALAQRSLDAARQMPQRSYQLEVRALCRFSAIYHGQGQEHQALEKAGEAISTAHENGLEYWETDALLRQAAAYYGQGNLGAAEDGATQALRTANRRKWPRLIALAQVNLAAVREANQQHQDVAGLTAALEYYRLYQFPKESLIPLLQLVRDKNDREDYTGGAKAGIQLLSLAKQAASPARIAQAEEAVGTSCLGLQQYPEALQHFDAALAAALQSKDILVARYQELHRAEALGRLGRIAEARQQLAGPADEGLGVWPSQIRVRLLSMQAKYLEAVAATRKALAEHTPLNAGDAAELRAAGAIAAAKSGAIEQAGKWVGEAAGLAQQSGDAETIANVNFAGAVVKLRSGSLQDARSCAVTALTFYQAHGQQESQWRTFHQLALIEKAIGSKENSQQAAAKSLYILSMFEHNWSASTKTSYDSRPDVAIATAELHQMDGK